MNFNHNINTTNNKALKLLDFIKRNTKIVTSVQWCCLLCYTLISFILIQWSAEVQQFSIHLITDRVQNLFLLYVVYIIEMNHSFSWSSLHPPHSKHFLQFSLNLSVLYPFTLFLPKKLLRGTFFSRFYSAFIHAITLLEVSSSIISHTLHT